MKNDRPSEIDDDLRSSPVARVLVSALLKAGRTHRAVRLACRFEGGEMHSRTARGILSARGVEVGAWSYGACFQLDAGYWFGCRFSFRKVAFL